ncbi:unnamed protein product [Linum tenue]|nr:unnamed protein product [Linum tenue]
MCQEMGVPFLGKVPLDPQLCKAAEEGRSCFEGQSCRVSAPVLRGMIEKLLKVKEWNQDELQHAENGRV